MLSQEREEEGPSLMLIGGENPNFILRQAYFLERDHRTNVIRFMEYMPTKLKDFLSHEEFTEIVSSLNKLCAEACKMCYWENFFDVISLFLFYYWYRNHFYRTVERMKEKVKKLNEKYLARGILIRCPSECAFAHLEIDVGSVPKESDFDTADE